MPNGGSDCCGTCWFNRANRGQAGHVKADPAIEPECEIRHFRIASPFYTYCANHPKCLPGRAPIPIGPVFEDRGRGREVTQPSPDSPEIREHLLRRLAAVDGTERVEYPIGSSLDAVVVWQAGEFRDERAAADLQRIARTHERLAAIAHAALEKIRAGAGSPR